MSENLDNGRKDYSKFDAMTTEELEEILRQDAESAQGQESDTEMILYVMEVLANRRNTCCTGKTALEAWESFQKHYYPESENILKHPSEHKRPGKTVRYRLYRIAAAAAVVVLLVFFPVVTKAFGWSNIWETVAKWAKETFSFVSLDETAASEPRSDNFDPYTSLQEALAHTNNATNMVPTWIPERYVFEDVTIDESPMRRTYIGLYKNGEASLKITVQAYVTSDPEKVEVNGELLETYRVSDVEYYIFSNNKQLLAVWNIGSYECYITGELTVKEIKEMIDSIGKG